MLLGGCSTFGKRGHVLASMFHVLANVATFWGEVVGRSRRQRKGLAMAIDRREFIETLSAGSLAAGYVGWETSVARADPTRPRLPELLTGEGLIDYVIRARGSWDDSLYKQLLGAANEFKEGDQIVGVAAVDEAHRQLARQLLANTRLRDLDAHPPLVDELYRALQSSWDQAAHARSADWTVGQLKGFLRASRRPRSIRWLPGCRATSLAAWSS